jgi:hypothetical protein
VIADDDTLNSMVVTVGSVSKARVFGLFVMTVTNSGSGAVLYSDDVNNLNITIQPYKKWLLSIYVQGDVVGATGSVDVVENHLGAVIPPSQGARGFTIAQAGVKQLVQYEIDLTARAITQVAIRVRVNTAHNSQHVVFFPPMLELQRGRTLSPSPWVEPKIGRIRSDNISTYMQEAAIDAAYIKLLAVDDLRIKDGAITLYQDVATSSTSVHVPEGQSYNVCSVVLPAFRCVNGVMRVFFSLEHLQTNNMANTDKELRIFDGSTQIYSTFKNLPTENTWYTFKSGEQVYWPINNADVARTITLQVHNHGGSGTPDYYVRNARLTIMVTRK